jgi:DNA-binding response OmpR family regulator
MHVLIVEDSVEIASLFTFLLRDMDIIVTTWVDDFPHLAQQVPWSDIDAILCDQYLDGYDGKELLAWLEAQWPYIRRVMLTADPNVNLHEAHADTVLIKPCETSVLLTALGVPSD